MQRGRGGRDPFSDFGDPFAGFGGFSSFGSFGGFGGSGRPQSLMSSFFGGRDPFDDPFFTNPFGGMSGSSSFGPGGSPFMGMQPGGSPFMGMQPSGFIENRQPAPKRSRGPIIEELNSDDEEEEAGKEKENPRKLGRSSNQPHVEDPADEVEERRNRQVGYMNDYSRVTERPPQSQARSFSFQSSTVTYGGSNGAYYTSSKTRRTGSDGVTVEESREADTTTREAAHRISRGLHDKGHTVTRKLNSDGRVNTMQTLHNLNEDELDGFEKTWEGNARKHLPDWPGSFGGSMGAGSSGQGGWALPSADATENMAGRPSHPYRKPRTEETR